LKYYRSINERNNTENGLDALAYFIESGDEFFEVSKDPSKKEKYSSISKYV
jgi:hypothetical protein